jgi:hypothetical protein
MQRLLYGLFVALTATAAMAQQRPIFDPDDFVNPNDHQGTLFVSSLVLGGAGNLIEDFRPLHQNAGFVQITNSFYWSSFQFDYKHSEVRGRENGPAVVQKCDCIPPLYFPTPPLPDATPSAPLPAGKDTLQAAWYLPSPIGLEGLPMMLRYRLTLSRQPVDTVIESFATGEIVSRLSGRERSFGLDADTYFRIGGHDIWGSLLVGRTTRTGTTDNRAQNELAYMSRFPGRSVGPFLLRATLTVGGVTGRGASGLNIVNPAFEAFWHNRKTDANVHLVWSPLAARSGTEGWQTHHQIALFVDRALYVKLFRPRKD